MTHRGKIVFDKSIRRWSGSCNCGEVWPLTRWRDAYDVVFYHVRARRRGQALGIGFTSGRRIA